MQTPPPLPAPSRPAVVTWFRVYAWALIGFLVVAGALSLLEVTGRIQPKLGLIEKVLCADDPAALDALMREKVRDSWTFLTISGVALPVLLVGAFMPEKPWSHTYGVAMIAASLLLCVTLPAAVALLVFWVRPEVRAFFAAQGQSPKPPPPTDPLAHSGLWKG